MWRRRLSVCSSVFLAISPCQPSAIGNHGEADVALPRLGARRGERPGPLCGMPTAIHHLVPCPAATPLLPDRRPLTQSGFNKFIWVFNLNSAIPPRACLPLPPWRVASPGCGWLSWVCEGDLQGAGHSRRQGPSWPGPFLTLLLLPAALRGASVTVPISQMGSCSLGPCTCVLTTRLCLAGRG